MGEVQRFYDGKSVFLTGGTGYLGKLIIHKLLKTTNVQTIYLIVRPKRGASVEERSKELLGHEIFSDVKHQISKIKLFSGDLMKQNIGLSEEDREILEKNTHIIIHCGAHLSMMSDIRESVFSNVRSTRDILIIARKCPKLISFLYISTAYSQCLKSNITEEFFEAPIKPELIIKMCEDLDEETLSRISVGLRGAWPNYYCYTKAVAESLIREASKSMPVGLVRPCVITSTAEEPIKGWTDNLYGPLGLILNINLGILRAICARRLIKIDAVPSDKVTNAILCTTWDVDQQYVKQGAENYTPPIMNYSANGSHLKVSIDYLTNSTRIALNSAIWYPFCFLIKNPMLFFVLDALFHRVPYYILNQIAKLKRKKPLVSRIFEKVSKASEALTFFMSNQWTVQNDNVLALWNRLDEADKAVYNFDNKSINPEEYFSALVIGLKQYIVKEKIGDIKKHENWIMKLKIVHFFMVGIILTLFAAIVKVPLISLTTLIRQYMD